VTCRMPPEKAARIAATIILDELAKADNSSTRTDID